MEHVRDAKLEPTEQPVITRLIERWKGEVTICVEIIDIFCHPVSSPLILVGFQFPLSRTVHQCGIVAYGHGGKSCNFPSPALGSNRKVNGYEAVVISLSLWFWIKNPKRGRFTLQTWRRSNWFNVCPYGPQQSSTASIHVFNMVDTLNSLMYVQFWISLHRKKKIYWWQILITPQVINCMLCVIAYTEHL